MCSMRYRNVALAVFLGMLQCLNSVHRVESTCPNDAPSGGPSLPAFLAKARSLAPSALAQVEPKNRSPSVLQLLSTAVETKDLGGGGDVLERAMALVQKAEKGASVRKRQAPLAVAPAPALAATAAPASAAVSAVMDSIEAAAKEAGATLNVAQTTVDGHLSEIEGMLDGLDYWSVRTPHLKGAVKNYINGAPGDLGGYRNNMEAFRAVLTTPAPQLPPAGPVPPPANLPPPAF